ncbi:hypothetical protein D1F64_10465 [Breoghania sp. L-A4]|nr:hypothetical protein D1F64_10465 [Breoghania sp. L-A4]
MSKRRAAGILVCGLLSGGLAAPAAAEDLLLVLQNTSSVTITEFYTSPADVDEWEEDVFADGVLPSGNEVEVTISDGRTQCVYDIRIITDDGDDIEDRGVDLCETGTYTFTD